MLTSPISLVIGANTHSLKRINNDNFGSVYISKEIPNVEVRLAIRNSYEGKTVAGQVERHNVDLQYTVFDAEGKPTLYQSYAVLRNLRGASQTIPVNVTEALSSFLDTNGASLIGWES